MDTDSLGGPAAIALAKAAAVAPAARTVDEHGSYAHGREIPADVIRLAPRHEHCLTDK